MAEVQPQLFKGLIDHDEAAPLPESALRLDLMTNAEIRALGRVLMHEFFTDATLEEALPEGHPRLSDHKQALAVEGVNESLLERYSAALKGLGRDVPLRGYELVEEIIADADGTGYDTEVAVFAIEGMSHVDPIAALEKLRELQPVAESRPDSDVAYEFKYDGIGIGQYIAEWCPGAGEAPIETALIGLED